MSPQWLEMRIQEEQDRRRKDAKLQELLPQAMDELHKQLSACIGRYREAFGTEAADIANLVSKLRITVREEQGGKWQTRGKIDVSLVSAPPSFKIERGEGDAVTIGLGLLSGDRFSYQFQDQYLTPEDVSRHVLDRLMFPNLVE